MQKIVVLGAGESGVGTAILAKQKGFDVFVSDSGVIKNEYRDVLNSYGICFEGEGHTFSSVLDADLVMKSPGIPECVSLVQIFINKGVPVISEIEFASKYTQATIIGITGSNGKTTTTMLTYHILKQAGLNVGVGGNIGFSFARQVAECSFDYYVLELSSFQLDGIVDFRPDIAVITNITPDHLDRYNYSFDDYISSKFRITKNQKAGDWLIYDGEDEVIKKRFKENKPSAKLVPFSLNNTQDYGAFINNKNITININKELFTMKVSDTGIKGQHNIKNTMAAALIAKRLGLRNDLVAASISDFEGAEHRLERVKDINGVLYVNDSKATNVNAAYYALDSFDKPIIWIVGGVDKGNDYFELMPLVRQKVKVIICLGLDNQKIIDTFSNVIDDIVEVASAKEAVEVAYGKGLTGDTVLLSPACASFDLFDSYQDRGTQFKNAINAI